MLMRTDPFRELDRLTQQFFGANGTTARPAVMPMDAYRAGVQFVVAFDLPGLPVDTHVTRVTRRLGLTRQEDPRKIEQEISSLLPEPLWGRAHQLLIWHGRRTCEARRPHCSRCVVADLCPRRGVKESD